MFEPKRKGLSLLKGTEPYTQSVLKGFLIGALLVIVPVGVFLFIPLKNSASISNLSTPDFNGELPAKGARIGRLSTKSKILNLMDNYNSSLSAYERGQIASLIINESIRHNIDPLLSAALIAVESSFNPASESRSGAKGLMQIIPALGEEMATELGMAWNGEETLFNPTTNVKIGIAFLAKLHKTFDRDQRTAILAYNFGPSGVKRSIEGGSWIESSYPEKVLSIYSRYRQMI